MDPSVSLSQVVTYLTSNASSFELEYLARRYPSSDSLETWDELSIMKMLLCHRSPDPPLPPFILSAIDSVLLHERSQKIVNPSSSIKSSIGFSTTGIKKEVRLSLWKGDITTLTQTTAIVNAANSRLLGCFIPHHKCIDNCIHAAAGPRLREACYSLMSQQGFEEPVGLAKVTPGFCLPSEYVIHTVGPALQKGAEPTEEDILDLRSCYVSCLEACEKLPSLEDGRKVLVFCCVSTGIFAFPPQVAAENAVSSVQSWLSTHTSTTITNIIFNVFSDMDHETYSSILKPILVAQPALAAPIPANTSLALASTWLNKATCLLITAGAGLSASEGLDYTSTSLFSHHFPAFTSPPYNFTCLYDLFRRIEWPSELARWGYYFNHLLMIRRWPLSPVYQNLLALSNTFAPGNVHIRTSNADGFFAKNGFDPDKISTPQGQYAWMQCATPCRQTATFASDPYLDAAIPFLDPSTQLLTDESKIPLCSYCGGQLVICVRGGDYFIEAPFRGQERVYRTFRHGVLRDSQSQDHDSKLRANSSVEDDVKEETTVILELGVGLSTPGVLRWPNEDLVSRGKGRIKLIRIGLDAAGCVDWDDSNMVGVQGDVGRALELLLGSQRPL